MPRQLEEDLRGGSSSRLSTDRHPSNKRVRTDSASTSPQTSTPRSPNRSPPRKRPGQASRVAAAARDAADRRRREREEEARKEISARRHDDLVSAHYNAVPQRGREWRKTDSQIRGLRSFNNWVKSALIQRFSLPDIPVNNLLVLDVGCGKGGDLQKWQSAPQMPALYVGVDPAEISIEQARSRYEEMTRRRKGGPRGRGGPMPIFDAQFIVQDAYGKSLAEIPIVRQVGFDPRAGPDANGNITGRLSGGGFDVISMMFCLHYSFESEEKARGMLKNVAGALKKGGKFLGVMPNSDVLSAHVEKHLRGAASDAPNGKDSQKGGLNYDDEEDDWDPEKPADVKDDDDDWDPEKPSDPTPAVSAPAAPPKPPSAEDGDDWDPEAPSEPPTAVPVTATPDGEQPNGEKKELPPLEWGNQIYTVKFPQTRPLPTDGVFRPPYGWKYFYYLEEAVNVPEYVVPWEGFRALAEDYGLELQYRKTFAEIWEDEKDDAVLGPLSERMGVRDRNGRFVVTPEEMEAASFYHAFVFYKI